jgi:hypothetical protein
MCTLSQRTFGPRPTVSDTPARDLGIGAFRAILCFLAMCLFAPSAARSQAVDLSQLPPHPRFFLTETTAALLRLEVAAGQPKNAMYGLIRDRATGYKTATVGNSIYAMMCLALVGTVEQDSSYTRKAVEFFQYSIDHQNWDTEFNAIEMAFVYDWLYPGLPQATRDAARTLALSLYDTASTYRAPPYYNLEANHASRRGITGLAFYGEGSDADNAKCQNLVDNFDARMRGVREFQNPGGSVPALGGVLPTRQKYFPDGGYYKGIEYAQMDIEAVTFYLALFEDLHLGSYWDLCGSYLDNWPEYILWLQRPDGSAQRLMSGTSYGITPRGYEALAILSAYRGSGLAAWALAHGSWTRTNEGAYGWVLPCILWRPAAEREPSTLGLAKFYGVDGWARPPTATWSEKVILRSGWNLDGGNDDVYFTMHAGDYFGDYWNFYQLAFEIYYRGALAIRSGYYMGGDAHLEGYNSRAVSANTVVVLDKSQPVTADIWGQDFLYRRPPGRPEKIGDVAEGNVYDTANILAYEDTIGEDSRHTYYIKGALRPGSAYFKTNASRGVVSQTREVVNRDRYFVIRDNVVLQNADRSVRFLLHTINRPTIEGVAPLAVTVADHVTTYPRARYSATRTELLPGRPPIQYDGRISCVPVLPLDATLRVVGGAGYECWVDDGNGAGQNVTPMHGAAPLDSEHYTNADEVGSWRVETIAPAAGTVDFVHAIFVGRPAEQMAGVTPIDEPNAVGCQIAGQGVFVFGRNPAGESQLRYSVTGELENAPQVIQGLLASTDYIVRIGRSAPLALRTSPQGGLRLSASGPCDIRIELAELADQTRRP